MLTFGTWHVLLTGVLNFSQFREKKDGKLGVFFFPIHRRVGTLGFLKSPWCHILSDCEDSLSDTVCLWEREGGPNLRLNYQFLRKQNVYNYITIMCQFKCWEHCFQASMRVKISKFSWRWYRPSDSPNVFGTNHICSPLLGFFQYAIIFS